MTKHKSNAVWTTVNNADFCACARQLLKQLKIKDWDYLIVSDGSGSSWDREIGWGSVLIENNKSRFTVRILCGSASNGSVNVAEIMAALWPLMWIAAKETDRVEKDGADRRTINVHIVTDSQYVKTTGEAGSSAATVKNASLWSALNTFTWTGIQPHWHWIRRTSHDFNKLADHVSKLARMQIKSFKLLQDGVLDEFSVPAK
jgi:ribonuclease HI